MFSLLDPLTVCPLGDRSDGGRVLRGGVNNGGCIST